MFVYFTELTVDCDFIFFISFPKREIIDGVCTYVDFSKSLPRFLRSRSHVFLNKLKASFPSFESLYATVSLSDCALARTYFAFEWGK